jgi:hypothetical protein
MFVSPTFGRYSNAQPAVPVSDGGPSDLWTLSVAMKVRMEIREQGTPKKLESRDLPSELQNFRSRNIGAAVCAKCSESESVPETDPLPVHAQRLSEYRGVARFSLIKTRIYSTQLCGGHDSTSQART